MFWKKSKIASKQSPNQNHSESMVPPQNSEGLNKPGRFHFIPWVIFLVAILFFIGTAIKTSPYRLLRPYSVITARHLISTQSQLSDDKSRWLVLIPAAQSGSESNFWIDQIPITIAAYMKCVTEEKCTPPHYRGYFEKYTDNILYRNYPITYVSWQEAKNYCEIHQGTLPTESQWMIAAGITFGFRYPWGDEEPNFALANYDGFYQGLTPAGWLPQGASPYGVLDMAGNVREWTLDPYSSDDNTGGDTDRILKGGSSSDYPQTLEITAFQWHSEKSAGFNRGFRCVYTADSVGTK